MTFVRRVVLWSVVVLATGTTAAHADPITPSTTGVGLVALGGEVSIFFAGSEAGFSSQLFLSEPLLKGPYFPNHETVVGSAEALGPFASGTELAFMLEVLETGDRFLTGPAARNPDAVVHAAAQPFTGSPEIPASGVLVGFEDLFGGGDFDFNDFSFVVSNAALKAEPVPEPGTFLLIATGMLGALLATRRRRTGVRTS
jgi:PEP-CTERM motif